MRHENTTVVPFPAERSAERRAAASSAPAAADPVSRAARAGTATAEAVADILDAADRDAERGDLDASKAANLSVLWGAVLGVARRHGQIPALAALEQVLERLQENPHHLITEPQHGSTEGGTARAVQALLSQG